MRQQIVLLLASLCVISGGSVSAAKPYIVYLLADQWRASAKGLAGDQLDPMPVGFIIDSPWLPNWCDHDIADYLTCDSTWWE